GWRQTSPWAASIDNSRVWRVSQWQPRAWADTSFAARQREGQRWDRESLAPRYNLLDDVDLISAAGSMQSLDFALYRQTALARGVRHGGWKFPSESVARRAGVDFFLGPDVGPMPGFTPVEVDGAPADTQLLRIDGPAPRRVRIAHEVLSLPTLPQQATPGEVLARTREVLDAIERAPAGAVVEWDGQFLPPPDDRAPAEDEERVDIVRLAPSEVVVAGRLAQPGLVVLADAYDPGWRCETDAGPLPIVRADRIFRGIWLPAGKFELRFRYRPSGFFLGAAVSAAAWAVLLLAAARAAWTARRKRSATQI
ncbi:MAG: hypothetical protein KDA41_10740, partial [Planctomycetales bacterium]|nr:hypothetical protein [Planctomycetales bacterium]